MCPLVRKLEYRCNLGKLVRQPFASVRVNQVMISAGAEWGCMRAFGSRSLAAVAEFDTQLVNMGRTVGN